MRRFSPDELSWERWLCQGKTHAPLGDVLQALWGLLVQKKNVRNSPPNGTAHKREPEDQDEAYRKWQNVWLVGKRGTGREQQEFEDVRRFLDEVLDYELGDEARDTFILDNESFVRDIKSDLSRLYPREAFESDEEDMQIEEPLHDTLNSPLINSNNGKKLAMDINDSNKYQHNDKTFNEIGDTTMAAAQHAPKGYKKEEIEQLDLRKLDKNLNVNECSSIPVILIVTLSNAFRIEVIEAASLLAENSRYLSLMLAKGVHRQFEPIIDWIRDLTNVKDRLIQLSLVDESKRSLYRILDIFKSGLVSRSQEVARFTCRLYSNISYCLLDNNALHYGYQWAIAPKSLMNILVLALKRHIGLIEEIVTVMLDFAHNRLSSLFEDSLPNILQNDMEYFRFLNTIFESLMAREFIRKEVEETELYHRWCQLAQTFIFNSELHPLLKTDFIVFLSLAWKYFPNLFEEDSSLPDSYLDFLFQGLNTPGIVMPSICLTTLFDLFEALSSMKRRFAPMLYKVLNDSFITLYKVTDIRNAFIKNYMHLLVYNDIPAEILMDNYLPYIQGVEKHGIELGPFDMELLKFLVSKRDLSQRHQILFFDIFCKLFIQNSNFASGVMDNIVDLAASILQIEEKSELVFKFANILFQYYQATYRARKVVIGHVDLAQSMQSHKRGLCISLLRSFALIDEGIQLFIKERALDVHFELDQDFSKSKKDLKHRGNIGGMKELIKSFGDPLTLIDDYKNSKLGNSSPRREASSEHKDLRDLDLSAVQEEQLNQEQSFSRNASKIQNSSLSLRKSNVRITTGKQRVRHMTKLELYESIRSKGLDKDEKEVAKLEKFKQKLERAEAGNRIAFQEEKEKEKKEQLFIRKHLNKRRIELGIIKRGDLKDGEDLTLLYPLGQYEKDAKKLENKFGVEQIKLVEFESIEEDEMKALRYTFSKYSRLWKYIFMSYANSIQTFEKRKDFETIGHQLGRISVPEFYKFIRDYRLDRLIQQAEIKIIFRLISIKVIKKENGENYFLDKNGFKDAMLQVILLSYSRSPTNLSDKPYPVFVEAFLEEIKSVFISKKKSVEFFTDPDKFNALGDKEVTEYLNTMINEDPEFELPQTYKVVEETVYSYQNKLPDTIKEISESYGDVFEILSDILEEKIGVSLKHPFLSEEIIKKVKPKTFIELDNEFNVRDKDAHMKKRNKNFEIKKPLISMNPPQIEQYKVEPCLELKLAVEYEDYRDKALSREIAEICEEILDAASNEDHHFNLNNKYTPKTILNDVLKRRNEEEERMKMINDLNQRKLKVRQSRLKTIIKKSKSPDKSPTLIKKKKNLTKSAKHVRPEKKLSKKEVEKLELYRKEQEETLKKYREEVRESKAKLKQEQSDKKRNEFEQRKKVFEEYTQKKVEDLKKGFEKISAKRKKEQERRKSYMTVKKEMKKQAEENLKAFKDQKIQIREKKKEINEFKQSVVENPTYENYMSFHEKQFKTLFNFYYNCLFREQKEAQKEPMVTEDLFTRFCNDFNLLNILIKPREFIAFFKQMNVERGDYDVKFLGITYEEFKQFNVGLITRPETKAILNKLYLNAYQDILDEEDEKLEEIPKPEVEFSKMKADEVANWKSKVKEAKKRNKEREHRNFLRSIKDTDTAALEGYLVYLELPFDRHQMIQSIEKHASEKTLPPRRLIQQKLGSLEFAQDSQSVDNKQVLDESHANEEIPRNPDEVQDNN